MTVINFPSPALSEEDEQALVAKVLSGNDYFGVERGIDERGRPCFKLLNRDRAIRGYVIKMRGLYCVLDARGTPVIESRSRDRALAVLCK